MRVAIGINVLYQIHILEHSEAIYLSFFQASDAHILVIQEKYSNLLICGLILVASREMFYDRMELRDGSPMIGFDCVASSHKPKSTFIESVFTP